VKSSDSAFAALGNEQFLSLTTFRSSGERVSTPMWVAWDGDALIMFTPQASGKVKPARRTASL
jgi:PPOX class probable F420-dependent enzyme